MRQSHLTDADCHKKQKGGRREEGGSEWIIIPLVLARMTGRSAIKSDKLFLLHYDQKILHSKSKQGYI
jgi:hypothetical protein